MAIDLKILLVIFIIDIFLPWDLSDETYWYLYWLHGDSHKQFIPLSFAECLALQPLFQKKDAA